jgi:probable phosphoglycerate mutase
VLNPVAFLYLRHGQTDWNARNVSQGNVDIPLNATGRAQAVQAAGLLKHRGIRTIVASPLSRARDTAATVAAALDLPVAIDEGLREASFGAQEEQLMGEWFHDWVAERFVPEGGEPFATLRDRAAAAINRATAREGLVLVVGHGAFFRAVRSAADLTADVRTQNAQPLRMDPPANGSAAWMLSPLD